MQVNIIWMILFIILVLGAAIAGITFFLLKRRCLRENLGIYLNVPETKKSGQMTLTIINVDKNPELFDLNLKELKLILLGRMSEEVVFERNPSIYGSINAVHSPDFVTEDVISLVGAIKYQKIFITPDNGKTKYKVRSIKVKSIQAIEDKFKKQTAKKIAKEKQQDSVARLKDRMAKSDAEFYLGLKDRIDEEKTGGVLCHSVESKATKNSIRHQLYIPNGHPFKEEFDPVANPVKFYHVYNGYLYEMDTEYVGMNGEVYKWDIINLEPNRIYVGLSYSTDGGKNIFPSSAAYGVTKSEEGHLPVIDEAYLGIPKVGATRNQIWSRDLVSKMYGPQFTRVYFSLMAKKHHELDIPDEFITLHDAACETAEEQGSPDCLCKKYTWLKRPFMVDSENATFTKEEKDSADELIKADQPTETKIVQVVEQF